MLLFSSKGKYKQCICSIASNKGLNCCHPRACVLNPHRTISTITVSEYFLVCFNTVKPKIDCLLSWNLAIWQLPVNPKPVKSTRTIKPENSSGIQSFKLFSCFLEDRTKQLASVLAFNTLMALTTKGIHKGQLETRELHCRATPAGMGRGNAVHEQPQCTKR